MGLERGKVALESYSKEWEKSYEVAAHDLMAALGEGAKTLQHIGSTAIPGVPSKPIIDMLLGVEKLEDVEKFKLKLTALGYEDRGSAGVPGRRFFAKGEDTNRTHYLHIASVDSDYFKDKLIFRNYLLANTERRQQYSKLKNELAIKYSDDRGAYTEAKTAFVIATLEEAKSQTKTVPKR